MFESLLIKLQAWRPNFIKKRFEHRCFLWILQNFQGTSGDCFCRSRAKPSLHYLINVHGRLFSEIYKMNSIKTSLFQSPLLFKFETLSVHASYYGRFGHFRPILTPFWHFLTTPFICFGQKICPNCLFHLLLCGKFRVNTYSMMNPIHFWQNFQGGLLLIYIINSRVDAYSNMTFIRWDALCNLVAFVQFKKCEKHPWRIATLIKLQTEWSLKLYQK